MLLELPKRIGSYRVDGVLGRGGMGAVYRGFDEQLGRPVAIKQIRSGELAEPEVVERFLREARSAAALRHPAIVQILHMIHDEGQDFIVMEFVRGKTLSALLKESGPIEPERAAALFRDIAEALAIAHGEGIIHRDIKAQNLMVTPEGQARVLDFGLAKRLDSEEVSLSATGKILGTPSTMSPEQARGEEVDSRSDLFSFGAVFYEALTGRAPFRADNVTTTLVKVCMEHPPPPIELDSAIPQTLSDLVVQLLQKDPENRPASAGAVAAALAVDESDLSTLKFGLEPATKPSRLAKPMKSTEPPGVGRRWAPLWVALLLAGAGAWWLARPSAELDRTPAEKVETLLTPRPSVAVLGLENLSEQGEKDWLATAITEVIATELRAGGAIRVIAGGEAFRARDELGLEALTRISALESAQLGERLGADALVWGTYSDLGGQSEHLLRIDLRLQDAATGEFLASDGATGTSRQLVGLISRTTNTFREQFGAGALTAADELESEAAIPSDPEALRLYAQGLAKLRSLDFSNAVEDLRLAVAKEAHPLLLSTLAEAWFALGYEVEAKAAAERARELSSDLPLRLRRLVEARYHVTTRSWKEAAETFEELLSSSPDDLDLGLLLVNAQVRAGEVIAATGTVEALERLDPSVASNPRIQLARALIAFNRGRPEEVLKHAEEAAQEGQRMQAPLIVAEARIRQSGAYVNLGEHARAREALGQAKELFEAHGGDRQGYAKALELIANSVLNRGDLSGAQTLFEEALTLYESIGNRRRVAGVHGSLAQIRLNVGELGDAEDLLQRSLDGFRAISDRQGEAIALNNLSACRFLQGRWQAAIDGYSEALTISEELRDDSGVAFASTNIAEILYIQGDLVQAQALHEEALRLNRRISDPYGIAYDTFRLGKILAAKGDLFAAKEKYAEALKIQNELGEKAAAAETRMEQAKLELAAGKAEAAAILAGQSEEVLRTEGWNDLALRARVVEIQSALIRDPQAFSFEQIRLLERDAKSSQDQRVTSAVAMTVISARAWGQPNAAAAEALLEIGDEAAQAGYVEESLEARLWAGRLEARRGDPARAAELLQSLESEARQRGFGHIAERAAAVKRGR